MTEKSDDLYKELFFEVKPLLLQGWANEEIVKYLSQKTDDIILITVAIKEAKKEYYAALRKDGLTKLAIGSVLIVVGFVITCFNFHTDKSVTFAMYGLTTMGLGFIFWGLFKMIG